MTTYHVTRQTPSSFDPDDERRIEIAAGIDNVSPGCLSSTYAAEGEYDSATAAARAAVELAALTGEPVTTSHAAFLGLYPTSSDALDVAELLAWAEKRERIDHEEAADRDGPWTCCACMDRHETEADAEACCSGRWEQER